MRLQLATVGLDELAEGLAIACLGPAEGCLDHRAVILSFRPPGCRLTKVEHQRRRRFAGESPSNRRPGRGLNQ